MALSFVGSHSACTLVGYDGASARMEGDEGDVHDTDSTGSDASRAVDRDGGSTFGGAEDGALTSPTQTSDAGSSASDAGSYDPCGFSSWLPGLIPDLTVIPSIPGITTPCTDADAGATASRDGGASDAGSLADAGKQDASTQTAADAATDASADASSADAGADAAQSSDQDASTSAPDASDAASDAGVQDAAQDAGPSLPPIG